MRIVVTGSQSFIGQRFIRLAREAGILVTGIDAVPGESTHKCVDIRDEAIAAVIPNDTAVIVHLAAISRDGDCRRDPRTAFDVNVTGTLNIARACRQRGVNQLVFASTEWVYGTSSRAVQREDDAIDIMQVAGEYALSKITAERLLAMACPGTIKNATVLRFGIVYGPRPTNWSAVESFASKVSLRQPITVGSLATAPLCSRR